MNVIVDEAFCVKHPQSQPGDYVLLEVSDTGCGMDEQTLEHAFEPFFTTKEEGRGTGLGLATVYGIVRQNGGIVTIQSEPGKGTIVRLYFPRHSGEKAAQSVAPPASYNLPGHGTVLLVEDDVSMRGVVRTLLEGMGFNVLEAGDPRDAVSMALAPGRTIHLLLTDVVLPFMSGKELQEKLRSMGIDIKTLFMSGFPADIIARHGVHRDGIHFIQKPFSLNALAEKIREVMES
jgi:CheY-like chemotaxis protein